MKARTRKWAHAGLAALFGAGSSIAEQLQSGALVSATRAVVVGVVLGALMRVAGAILAAIAFDEPETPAP